MLDVQWFKQNFGLKGDDPFKVIYKDTTVPDGPYSFQGNTLVDKHGKASAFGWQLLQSGMCTLEKVKWIPNEGERYYFPSTRIVGKFDSFEWDSASDLCRMHEEYGLICRNRNEARELFYKIFGGKNG
jgi:hypothetical protein